RGRRGLGDEGEGAVRVRGDHGRDRQARLHLLRGGVERLAELHDVQAALAQGGTDRRARIGLPGWHLQLDVADYFLCHCWTPASANACSGLLALGAPPGRDFSSLRRSAGAPGCRGQAFSTWPNSSSTGVDRPKISTATRRRLFS